MSPTTLRTDADGRVRIEGWKGDYRVTVAGGEVVEVTIA
jgi:hypothetical protein